MVGTFACFKNQKAVLFEITVYGIYVNIAKNVVINITWVRMIKSVRRYNKTLYKFLLRILNHTLKGMYMLNYGIISNMNNLYYSSIEALI